MAKILVMDDVITVSLSAIEKAEALHGDVSVPRTSVGLHAVVRRGSSGSEYRLFALPHGEWIRLLGRYGLVVEDLIEVQVPPGAINNDFPEFPDQWVRRWPAADRPLGLSGAARSLAPRFTLRAAVPGQHTGTEVRCAGVTDEA